MTQTEMAPAATREPSKNEPLVPVYHTFSPDETILRYLAAQHGGVEARQISRDTGLDGMVVARELSHLELQRLAHRFATLWFYGGAA